MSFLEDLLILQGPLRGGIKIYPDKLPLKKKSTWEYLLPRNRFEINYKVHYTKGGLPLILPHDYLGRIKKSDNPKKRFVESKSWFNFPSISNGFRLVELLEKKRRW